jgi:aryl-alcohol dehydrogenase-like predicted oxidoreductase
MGQTQEVEKRTLGNSDLEITPLGFGAWAIGGGNWAYAWGPQDDDASIDAILASVTEGRSNWIDTAPVYGLGHSEEVVAKALMAWRNSAPAGAKAPYIFTKCGLVWDENRQVSQRLTAQSVRAECEASLRRLKVDAIDLYQIHWPLPEAEIEEAWTTIAELLQEGKIRYAGVSNFHTGQMKRAQAIAPITSLQPPYSMLRRQVETEILPYCQTQNIGVIAYSPMLSGMLTGAMTKERAAQLAPDDWRRNNKEFQEPRLSHNLALVEKLRELGLRHGRSPGEVALAWVLHHPAITGAIVGGRSRQQVLGTSGAQTFRLSDEEYIEVSHWAADCLAAS